MINPKHYTHRVYWIEEDGEYVGLCAEFPSLSHLDNSMEAAEKNMSLNRYITDKLARSK